MRTPRSTSRLRQQAAAADLGVAVARQCLRLLLANVEGIRRLGLHAEGRLHGFNGSLQLGVAGAGGEMLAIERRQQIHLSALRFR